MGVKLEVEVSRHHPVRLGFLVLTDWDLGHQTAYIGDFPVDQRAHVNANLGKKSMLW